jgi:hypothetical protein
VRAFECMCVCVCVCVCRETSGAVGTGLLSRRLLSIFECRAYCLHVLHVILVQGRVSRAKLHNGIWWWCWHITYCVSCILIAVDTKIELNGVSALQSHA